MPKIQLFIIDFCCIVGKIFRVFALMVAKVDNGIIFGQHGIVVMNSKGPIIVLMLVVVLAVGFLLGMIVCGYRLSGLVVTTTNLDVFTSATALIQGTVTGVDQNIATVKNQNGSVGKYVVSEEVGVFTLKPGVKQSTASAGLNEGLLNKESVIQLNYQNGRFEIISVSLVPESLSISASPTPKK